MSAAAAPRRTAALSLWALLLVLAVLQIVRSPFHSDLSAFLPAAPDPRQKLLIEQIHSGLPSRTLLVGIAGGSAVDRAAASRELAAALRASGRFDQVHNGEHEGLAGFGQWLFEQRYALSPAVGAERFTPEGLRAAIDEALSLLGTPAGEAIKPTLDRDPTGETQRITESLIPSRSPRSEHGVWVGRQQPRALLMATTRAAGADLDGQAAAIAELRRAFEPAAARGLTLELSGAPLFSVDSRARIEREAQWLAAAATLVMGVLLAVTFGSLPALAVALLPVGTGVLAGIAAVGLAFGSVHSLTLAFGATLIGESVDYAIYYLIQARPRPGQAADGHGWSRWVREAWPTVRLGLATSVCGFAALVFSGFGGLAQLGLFSIAGLLAAALATRWLLPALMPDGARGGGLRAPLGRAARAAAAWLPRLRTPLLALAALAAAVLLARGELWRADLSSLSPVPQEALALDESLRADLQAGDGGTLVVVQGQDLETTLQRAEAAVERLEALLDRGTIGGFDSVTRVLPSQATQQRRRHSLPEAAALRSALDAATRDGPLRAARLAPFVEAVAAARNASPITAESLRGTPVAPLADALLLRRADGSAAALLPVQPARDAVDARALAAALEGVAEAQVLEIGPELGSLYRRYLREAQVQALAGAAAVVVLVALWLRSARRLLAVVQPLALAVLLTMGGFAALGAPLGILHLIGLLLVVAVGSNYALFFDLLREVGDADDDTLASLLLANATTVVSFGLLACSSIPVLAAIGRVVAPGALLALVLAAAFAPAAGRPAGGRKAL